MNLKNDSLDLNTTNVDGEALTASYRIVAPILISLSMLGFLMNLVILMSIISSRNLIRNRNQDKYLPLIVSLLTSDSINSLLLGILLLCGSYLPVVHQVSKRRVSQYTAQNFNYPWCCLLIIFMAARRATQV